MNLTSGDTLGHLLLTALALRVFGPDLQRGVRRLLGAGVRMGAVELASHEPLPAHPHRERKETCQ